MDVLDTTTTTMRSALSGVAGSTSLACWIVLLLPQLLEQWRLKSADGIALPFICLWFLGDLTNLAGSIWAGLLPQVVMLAIWFCFADGVTIGSFYYYRLYYPHHTHKKRHSTGAAEEATALINHRRNSSALEDLIQDPEHHSVFTRYILPILFVILAGVVGFFISPSNSDDVESTSQGDIETGPQVLGYISAFLYLTARIPQMLQNYRKKSCEGLSLLFFIFSTMGNLTYSLQILFYRSDWDYVLLNMSWILGSLGTIFEDAIIFFQFYLYSKKRSTDVAVC